ncbi:ABC transporter ATP-binding protein [Ancylobacter sp. Lp-2]|uniref:dipeptide ABC transporter ATP-binding protein n=1 Tax=Ancylobacter sp. Lp-2 TaxID=2881339 RepID=UPI001E4DE187|nr:ABC transporter ATP-binding protein [Ancylobacter sp. Lp-2]MCB4770443.1 ABC transporter ATP-binding protein [Ancylobacter sp. Lp-2]
MTDTSNLLLAVRGLKVAYRTRDRVIEAVRGVDIDVRRGEVVALVGESGSGKSTIAHAIMGMLPPAASITAGTVTFDGEDLTRLSERAYRRLRGQRLGWVPQDPMVALNPSHRVGRQVAEPLLIHRLASKAEAKTRAIEALGRVGLGQPEIRAEQFPHELSGGMRQRALIAGALICGPALIVADEPTTALDVTVQKRILDDIGALAASSGTAVLIITHDLAVAADRADRIVVLRHGTVMEEGDARDVLRNPQDAYTRLLLASAPSLSSGRRRHATSHPAAGAVRPLPDPRPPLVAVENVTKDFAVSDAGGHRGTFRAVDGVSLAIAPGETLGLVGESGSGKSTLARIVLGLVQPTSGEAKFEGRALAGLSAAEERERRRQVQPVYQNPFSSLNPRLTVAEIVGEPLAGFRLGDREWRRRRTLELLDQVGLPHAFAERLPAELSGGQRQRVAIARALAPEPALVVCDEPVSALDVSIQAQVLDLLAELQHRHGLAYLFISHDLAVVRQVSDRVGVMKDGRIVELDTADEVFRAPKHPYTRLLLDSIPGRRLAEAS